MFSFLWVNNKDDISGSESKCMFNFKELAKKFSKVIVYENSNCVFLTVFAIVNSVFVCHYIRSEVVSED